MKRLSEEAKVNIFILALLATCLILLFILNSCRSPASVTTTREVRIVERDTCIITRTDSASAIALLHCDSAYNVVIDALTISEGKNIGLEARLKQIGSNSCPRAEMAVSAKKTADTIYLPIRDTYTSDAVSKTEIVYRNTSFARFCIMFFWTAVGFAIAYIAYKIFRFRLL